MIAELLARIIFGWPFIIIALLLSVMGVVLKRSPLLIAGGLFFMPPSLYLSGYPFLRWFAFLLPICMLVSDYFVRKDKLIFAWLMLLPPVAVSGWLAYLVMTQARNLSGG